MKKINLVCNRDTNMYTVFTTHNIQIILYMTQIHQILVKRTIHIQL